MKLLNIPISIIFILTSPLIASSQNKASQNQLGLKGNSRHYSEKAKNHFYKMEPDSAFLLARTALRLAKKDRNILDISHAQFLLGDFHLQKGNNDSSKYYFTQIKSYSQLQKDETGLHFHFRGMGKFYIRNSETEKARQAFEIGISKCKENGPKSELSLLYTELAVLLNSTGKYDEAYEKIKESLLINDTYFDSTAFAYTNLVSGSINQNKKNFQEALSNYEGARKIYAAKNYSLKVMEVDVNTANTQLELLSTIIDPEQKMNQFRITEDLYLKCIKFFQDKSNYLEKAIAYINLGSLYLEMGKHREALTKFKQGIRIFEGLESVQNNRRANPFSNLGDTYYQMEEFDSAKMAYNIAFMLVTDSALNPVYRGFYEDICLGMAKTCAQLGEIQTTAKLIELAVASTEEHEKVREPEFWKIQFAEKKIWHNLNQTIYLFIIFILLLILLWLTRKLILKRSGRLDQSNGLPVEMVQELKRNGSITPRKIQSVTILFTDFVGFTGLAENDSIPAKDLVRELNACFMQFDLIMTKYGLEKIKTIGDAYMGIGGAPNKSETHPEDVINAALEMRDFITERGTQRRAKNNFAFDIRIGVNTGQVIAGVLGKTKLTYDVWGDSVNIANRLESKAETNKVNVSESTKVAVRGMFSFSSARQLKVKGKKDPVLMYHVERKNE